MICLVNKFVLFAVLSIGFVWVIIYHSFIGISQQTSEGPQKSFDDHLLQQNRKFVAISTKNNEIKVVYIDNDNMDNIEDLSREDPLSNASGDFASSGSKSSYYESSSAGTENPYSIEWDETIDYDHYERPAVLNKSDGSLDVKNQPQNTIVLVQEFYHCNNPLTNIMYRYGVSNQLTFALPKMSTFQTYWPLRFHSSFVDRSLTFSTYVNMLINPRYRYETIKRFMPKEAVFIAVLHDPIKDFFTELVNHPSLKKFKRKQKLKIIKNLVQKENVFGEQYTNTMAAQFGYPKKRDNQSQTAREVVDELTKQFDVVLIGDYFDESLVVLKNVLNWSLTDLVYIDKKKTVDIGDIPAQIKDGIIKLNNLDHTIYQHFNATFWQKVKCYGFNITSDLETLQRLNRKVENFCKWEGHDEIMRGTEGDTVCSRMKWSDLEYVSYLKNTTRVIIDNELKTGLEHLKKSLDFFFNTTSKEIQRYIES